MRKDKNKMVERKIIIAGGGTGGHIFPAIAIANAIKRQDPLTDILFVGTNGKMEMEKIPQAGYRIKGLDIAGFNRSSVIKNFKLPFKLAKSFIQVRRIFKDYKPNAVIGVGGYSSFPVLRLAQSKGIPTFIHESNAFAGKSNILLGKKANRIFTATIGMEKFFPPEKIMVSGNPVRTSISQSRISREEGLRFFGLDPGMKTVLSMGGSLGAKSINEAIAAGIDSFEKNFLQLIWQTGKPFAPKAEQLATGRKNVWTCDFITKMEYAFAASDVVISRSGAMAVAELCVAKKPVVFVPYPFASENHQRSNAEKLVNDHAAIMINDNQVADSLVDTVTHLAADNNCQAELREAIFKWGITNADDVIANEILKSIK